MRLALYQPEIPQNTGTLMRLGACMGVGIDIIEPCGFIWDDARLKRAGMDYMELANVTRHPSFEEFLKSLDCHPLRRLAVAMTENKQRHCEEQLLRGNPKVLENNERKECNLTPSRLILLDTKATTDYLDFEFHPNDVLMVGRESDGVPDNVFNACAHKLKISMLSGVRSLNVAIAASMVLGEALRQTLIRHKK